MAISPQSGGDTDLAVVGSVVADPTRCRILLALDDGRALPASRLAEEAGVAPSTASSHLGKLVAAGFLTAEAHGRHRYYRLAGPHVGRLIEALGAMAPVAPVRSLRQGTRAAALRRARTCYDHLAGRLAVEVMAAMIAARQLEGGDGRFHPTAVCQDRPSAPGHDVDYALTRAGERLVDDLGIAVPARRPVVRYCVDWTEQRHHLAGGLGRGLLDRFLERGWVVRAEQHRAVTVTAAGAEALPAWFGDGVLAAMP